LGPGFRARRGIQLAGFGGAGQSRPRPNFHARGGKSLCGSLALRSVIQRDPVAIFTPLYGPPPSLVRQIPVECAVEAGCEAGARANAEFVPELVRADGIAAVMPRPVLHERD